MPVFFIERDQIHDNSVCITGPLLRHLQGSLRIEPGEEVIFVVPRQHLYRVRVDRVNDKSLMGVVLDEQPVPLQGYPQIGLAQSILKGERMDWLIQKATELGVARITPLVTRQGVVRPREERVHTQHERWRRIAVEAAQQAERSDIPELELPVDSVGFFENASNSVLRLILSERSRGQTLASICLPSSPEDRIVLAVGPEGGWRQEELDSAGRAGFVSLTLGQRILRAETAGLAALTILQSRLGQLG